MSHLVYILHSETLDKYYVGRTENIELRLQYHNDPIESRKFTARGVPWVLKCSMVCSSKEHSVRLEDFIKKLKSRSFIERIINDLDIQKELIKKTSTWLLISPEASG